MAAFSLKTFRLFELDMKIFFKDPSEIFKTFFKMFSRDQKRPPMSEKCILKGLLSYFYEFIYGIRFN